MTLSKLTTLLMVVTMLIIFVGTLVITMHHSKTYFEEQMAHTAQDTATALGLSISKQISKSTDTSTMLLLVSAVFDRGNFSSIVVRNLEGRILVNRYLKEVHYSAPNWFVKMIGVHNKEGTALIIQGWHQIGEVVVRGDDAVVYKALWSTAKKLFVLFTLMIGLLLIISLLLIKIMFRSLEKIVRQADDIGKKNLYTLDKLPKLKELHQLSVTMNSMVNKLKQFFLAQIEETEQLRAKAYQDSLTGKGNRRYFFQQINQYLNSEEYFLPGFLFLIELRGLAEFNLQYGYREGDQVIIGVSECLDDLLSKESVFLFARLDGPCFGVIILGQDGSLMEQLGRDIYTKINVLIKEKQGDLSLSLGIVSCQFSESATDVLAVADTMIKVAEQKGGGYGINLERGKGLFQTSESWLSIIQEAIEKKQFRFYWQPVKSSQIIYHHECFVKLLHGKNEVQAKHFFPIVEQYSLGGDIDRLVFETIVQSRDVDRVALNLSSSTVGDKKTQDLFLSFVEKWTKPNHIEICFEFSEFMLDRYRKSVVNLVNVLVKLGYQVGLDRVGATLTPLNYLEKLNVSYLKLDGNFSKNIGKDKLKHELLSNWVLTAERLDVTLIATAVESEGQWHFLSDLGLIYFQGNYIQGLRILDLHR